jgi:ribosomal protein S18 acetylase RimI-like enzyme
MSVQIVELHQVTDDVVDAFARLIPQLSQVVPPSRQELESVIASPCCTILLALDQAGEKIVGTLTLVMFRTPTGRHAWIEDVVVDSAYRSQGIGEALTRAGLQRALSAGAKHVDLTSHPRRAAANRLYQRIGFQKRDTNLYRIDLS